MFEPRVTGDEPGCLICCDMKLTDAQPHHGSTPRRIALLTPEYVTEHPSGGGLATYASRMAAALRDAGHQPEVFTLGKTDSVVMHEGVRVEHVTAAKNLPIRLLGSHWRSRLTLGGTIAQLGGALAMATALHKREASHPFDAVQSSDWGLAGYYVQRNQARPHVLRCSWSRWLYQKHSGSPDTLDHRMLTRLERKCVRNADIAYAPSRFIAEQVTRETRRLVSVIRPPMMPRIDETVITQPPAHLPSRYLVHFGQLGKLKGTDTLASAITIALQKEPSLRVVFAGKQADAGLMEKLTAEHPQAVCYTGPLDRGVLYAVVKNAVAAVLPSRCDNLPNTAIESLSMGLPVIGSRGASIDELVRDGHTGMLVEIGNAETLADALVAMWRKPMTLADDVMVGHDVLTAMQPARATAALLAQIDAWRSTRRQAA